MIYLIPLYLAFASRLHGGGFFPLNRQIRNALFALPYMLIYLPTAEHSPTFLLAFIFAFIGINIGHDNFWNMGVEPNSPELNWLGKIVKKIGFTPNTLGFCWTGMMYKAMIISVGTEGWITYLVSIILYPLSYYIGMRSKWNNVCAEYLSGLFLGIALIIGWKINGN